jgi:hypothetical protein
MDERLRSVADLLLRDGCVDNTPDAYLAAIRILAAADRLAEHEVPRPAPHTSRSVA